MSITCALYLLFGFIMVQRWVCWIVGVSTYQVCWRYFFRGNSSVAFQQRHHWCKKRYWSSVIVKIVREICLPAFPAYEKVYVVALVIEHTFFFRLFLFWEKNLIFFLFFSIFFYLGKFTQTVHHYRREIHFYLATHVNCQCFWILK